MASHRHSTRRLRLRAEAVRETAREVLGLDSDIALAEALHVHPSTLCQLMTGRNEPSGKVIIAMIDALGGTFEDYVEIINHDEPNLVGAAA